MELNEERKPIDKHIADLRAHLQQECAGPVRQREEIADALSSIPILKRREEALLWRIRLLWIGLLLSLVGTITILLSKV